MEIIAVYWEPKIKTYGFQVKTDLRLYSANISVDQMAEWGDQIENGGEESNFLMTLVQMASQETLRVHLLFDQAQRATTPPVAIDRKTALAGIDFRCDSPVELVYFQGPHFGDRYGIADAAFRALAAQSIPVLAAGCTGASIYIVVADKQAKTVIRCLSESFTVPETDT